MPTKKVNYKTEQIQEAYKTWCELKEYIAQTKKRELELRKKLATLIAEVEPGKQTEALEAYFDIDEDHYLEVKMGVNLKLDDEEGLVEKLVEEYGKDVSHFELGEEAKPGEFSTIFRLKASTTLLKVGKLPPDSEYWDHIYIEASPTPSIAVKKSK